MLLIVEGRDHSKYSSYIYQLFRLRYSIFVERRKWTLPTRNGFEIDQYDTDKAVYFLLIADDGSIEASVRLTPTIHSSLLADIFPQLVETGEAPRSPWIYEATRYIVSPSRKTRAALRKTKATLLAAMLEWSLDRQLAYLQTIIDTAALGAFLEITPHTRVLGLSCAYGGGRGVPGGGECLAFRWPVTTDVLDDIIAYGDLEDHRPERAPRRQIALR